MHRFSVLCGGIDVDLHSVESLRTPTGREQLYPLAGDETVLAGGTYLFSQPHPDVRRLVDITTLGWEPVTFSANGIDLAATCTVAQVADLSASLPPLRPEWTAAPLFRQCATALLASFKIWSTATVGGNLCLSLPAGAMISLTSALGAHLTVWRGTDGEYTVPVEDFVVGPGNNILTPGDVLRSVHLPAAALRARTAFRKLALAPLGRSGIVVIGRTDTAADGGCFTLSVTASTVRPYVFRFDRHPGAAELRAALAGVPEADWTDDAHGDPDWRAAMTELLAEQIRKELG